MNSSSSSFHLFIFAVAVVFLRCLYPTGAATCHPDDEAGLLAFKSGITQDPYGILNSWKKGTDCCSWRYINCEEGGRVNSLIINDDGKRVLSGTISPSLAKLRHLQDLYLLDLKNITGSIPESLLQMPKLQYLNLGNCGLSGTLPANVSMQSQLVVFIVGDNFLTGTIPLEFGNLKNIVMLDFRGNHLSGTIPDIFKSMTSLKDVLFSRNNFSGKFPQSIASLPPSQPLRELDLSWNQFSGTVPKSFSKLSFLHIDLSHNLLTDPFPVFKNKRIQTLDLSYNKFNLKMIPKWVTSAPDMYVLKLAKCGIKMSFDDWKPKKTALYGYIDLSENQISGSPARFLKEKNQTMVFRASGNKLRFDMGKLNFSTTLETLDLSRNSVFGKVPATVAGLKTLDLSHNHLCGKLPVTKFPANVFAGNDCLCGSPLPPCKL